MKPGSAVLHLTVGDPYRPASSPHGTKWNAGINMAVFGFFPAFCCASCGLRAPKRWELIGALREGGAMTVAELARQLKRDYKNVHSDCERLIEWMAIEKNENGLVCAPYDEIVVDMKLPDRRAA